jgi:hypothetical protein
MVGSGFYAPIQSRWTRALYNHWRRDTFPLSGNRVNPQKRAAPPAQRAQVQQQPPAPPTPAPRPAASAADIEAAKATIYKHEQNMRATPGSEEWA